MHFLQMKNAHLEAQNIKILRRLIRKSHISCILLCYIFTVCILCMSVVTVYGKKNAGIHEFLHILFVY